MSLTMGQVEAAANWWSEVVGAPKFDSGDPVYSVLASQGVVPANQFQKSNFYYNLREELTTSQSNYLGCDYSPDQILSKATLISKIPKINFPCKTSMWLTSEGTVEVRYGYGAPIVQIYPVIS